MNRERLRRIAIPAAVVLALGLAVGGVLWQRCGLRGCPDVERLKGYMPDEASVVFDRDGEEIGKLYVTRRVVVELEELPAHVSEAFVAIEDQRFWTHGGVDWRRVVGALASNVRARGVEEGSSTITMQLARNVFPEQLPADQRTLWRKLGEARMAREIERRHTKEEILELYVNQIYYGSGAWGIEAAAQEYFGKSATELELPESAMLAALPRAPSRLNPRANRDLALEGRALVLRLMAEQGRITDAERASAQEAPLELRQGESGEEVRAAYFMEAVRRQLERQFGSALYSEGFRIHTTLDLGVQRVVEEEIEGQLRAVESGRFGRFAHASYASLKSDTTADLSQGTSYLQAAVVLLDARNGDVLALVGGRDFRDSEYNRATQAKRQPGSAFKPFVYAAALSSGYSPAHRLLDQPLRMELSRGQYWEPRNYDGGYAGIISVRDALVRSKNVATVRLANGVGVGRIARVAEQMGLGGMPTNPSMVLGTAEVTPLELAAAYTPFATLGTRVEPRFVTRVEDRHGHVVWSVPTNGRRVLDPAVAFVMTNMMEDVVTRGTGTAVRAAGLRGPAAGKTGTSQDAADVWFVGFTPELVGAVWVGFDRRQTVLRGATGGEVAAPVWGRIVHRAGLASNGGWVTPSGVEQRDVLHDGTVLAMGCPDEQGGGRSEYFVRGTAPASSCYPSGSMYAWGDTLGYRDDWDDFAPDTLDPRDDDRWWSRMRERVIGRDVPQDAQVPRTAAERLAEFERERAARADSVRAAAAADTAGRPPLLGRPVDTTAARRSPADTLRRPPPDTTRRPPPDTTRRPPPDTTRRPPPDTTRRPPPDTAGRPLPDPARWQP